MNTPATINAIDRAARECSPSGWWKSSSAAAILTGPNRVNAASHRAQSLRRKLQVMSDSPAGFVAVLRTISARLFRRDHVVRPSPVSSPSLLGRWYRVQARIPSVCFSTIVHKELKDLAKCSPPKCLRKSRWISTRRYSRNKR